MFVVIFILTVLVASLGIITMILARKVRFLGRRPRIKKRIVVNKSITPLTYSRQPPEQNQQCEITIENCCNMNICETVSVESAVHGFSGGIHESCLELLYFNEQKPGQTFFWLLLKIIGPLP
jgi:hypothetical protein